MVSAHTAPQTSSRPMDDVQYSWMSPQEDEFALLALGAPSPYEALLVPSLLHHPRALLDLDSRPVTEQERWTQTIQYFLRLLTVQQGKAMVLKSPPHGFRLRRLRALFPGARYVLIERNPYEVFASNLKLWRTLMEMYSQESFSVEEIEAFILEAYLIHEEAIAAGTRDVSGGVFARLRYEHLVADPVGQMERLYNQLGLQGVHTVRPAWELHVKQVAQHKRNRFVLSAQQRSRVDGEWGSTIRDKGYGQPSDYITLSEPK